MVYNTLIQFEFDAQIRHLWQKHNTKVNRITVKEAAELL